MGAEEIIQWIAIGASLMGSATLLALKILDRRNSKKEAGTPVPGNPGSQLVPGKEQECIDRGKQLTKLESDLGNLGENFKCFEKKNREDHQEIFRLLRNRK